MSDEPTLQAVSKNTVSVTVNGCTFGTDYDAVAGTMPVLFDVQATTLEASRLAALQQQVKGAELTTEEVQHAYDSDRRLLRKLCGDFETLSRLLKHYVKSRADFRADGAKEAQKAWEYVGEYPFPEIKSSFAMTGEIAEEPPEDMLKKLYSSFRTQRIRLSIRS